MTWKIEFLLNKFCILKLYLPINFKTGLFSNRVTTTRFFGYLISSKCFLIFIRKNLKIEKHCTNFKNTLITFKKVKNFQRNVSFRDGNYSFIFDFISPDVLCLIYDEYATLPSHRSSLLRTQLFAWRRNECNTYNNNVTSFLINFHVEIMKW